MLISSSLQKPLIGYNETLFNTFSPIDELPSRKALTEVIKRVAFAIIFPLAESIFGILWIIGKFVSKWENSNGSDNSSPNTRRSSCKSKTTERSQFSLSASYSHRISSSVTAHSTHSRSFPNSEQSTKVVSRHTLLTLGPDINQVILAFLPIKDIANYSTTNKDSFQKENLFTIILDRYNLILHPTLIDPPKHNEATEGGKLGYVKRSTGVWSNCQASVSTLSVYQKKNGTKEKRANCLTNKGEKILFSLSVAFFCDGNPQKPKLYQKEIRDNRTYILPDHLSTRLCNYGIENSSKKVFTKEELIEAFSNRKIIFKNNKNST
jgi:hypothetical protein